MSDEYDHVARGKLKLKTDSGKITKKHKKTKTKKEKCPDISHVPSNKSEVKISEAPNRQLTNAEIAFKKMQVKMVSCVR